MQLTFEMLQRAANQASSEVIVVIFIMLRYLSFSTLFIVLFSLHDLLLSSSRLFLRP